LGAARTGGAATGYADAATAFLALGVLLTRDGGRVGLVQPQSVLSARDAGGVRDLVDSVGRVAHLWVAGEPVFEDASVFVCSPVIEIGGSDDHRVGRSRGAACRRLDAAAWPRDDADSWSPLAAAALGVPEPAFESAGELADIASATADFRDEYYGLSGAVVEDPDASFDPALPVAPLVTSGMLDAAACLRGTALVRIHKVRWLYPAADVTDAGEFIRRWAERRRVPKVLLATQTRALEAWVDEVGGSLPVTPVITIGALDGDPKTLWRIAAAVSSPVCAAVAMQRFGGAALTAGAIKLSAKQALTLPTPPDDQAWVEGAEAFRNAQHQSDEPARIERLHACGIVMNRPYRVDAGDGDALVAWWRERLVKRHRGRR